LRLPTPKRAGRYTLTLTVTDARGQATTVTRTVTVTREHGSRSRTVTRTLHFGGFSTEPSRQGRAALLALRRYAAGADRVMISGQRWRRVRLRRLGGGRPSAGAPKPPRTSSAVD